MWASWPQACMTPTFSPARYLPLALDANGRPSRSLTGSASMSARRATTGPGLPPLSTPTTPVPATPVRTSRGRACAGVGDEACGARLLFAELGVLMDVAPPGDQLLLDLRGALANFFFKVWHDGLRRRRLRPRHGKERNSENGGVKKAAHKSPP